MHKEKREEKAFLVEGGLAVFLSNDNWHHMLIDRALFCWFSLPYADGKPGTPGVRLQLLCTYKCIHTGGCSSCCEGQLLSPVVSCEGAVSSECSECVCSSAGKEGLPAICESTW